MSSDRTKISNERVAAAEEVVRPNLYQRWRSQLGSSLMLLQQDSLTADDAGLAKSWAGQWGWRIRLHASADGSCRLIEVFGPDNGADSDPIGLVYRTRGGFQVDEWTGKSWQWASLDDALSFTVRHL